MTLSLNEKSNQYACWVNGQTTDSLSIHDRSIQYGDGFFTTILVLNECLLNWHGHWQRIRESCLRLKLPEPNEIEIQHQISLAIKKYLSHYQVDSCIFKLILTRGQGGQGYQMPIDIKKNVIFVIKPYSVHLKKSDCLAENPAIKAGVCEVKSSINDFAGIKTLNRLENVMARTEVVHKGWAEGLMLNQLNSVVCATQSNVYLIKNHQIFTPSLSLSGVAGTTRFQLNHVLENLGWEVIEKDLVIQDIEQADELFLTNAVRGVQPVNHLILENHSQQYNTEKTKNIHQAWSNWQMLNRIPIHNFTSLS